MRFFFLRDRRSASKARPSLDGMEGQAKPDAGLIGPPGQGVLISRILDVMRNNSDWPIVGGAGAWHVDC
jgi:hypothetical protein